MLFRSGADEELYPQGSEAVLDIAGEIVREGELWGKDHVIIPVCGFDRGFERDSDGAGEKPFF